MKSIWELFDLQVIKAYRLMYSNISITQLKWRQR